MASGGSTCWFLETNEDQCIYLIRDEKCIGKVAAVRLIKETTEPRRPALIGIQLFSENKQRGLRFDRFKPDANNLSKIFGACSGCAQFADTFTKSIYPHINSQTGVYSPPCENTDPSSSTYTRKRPSCSHQPKGKKKHKQSETSTNDEDLEESLKSRYQGQFSLPICCMKAPSTSRAVREVDSLFIEHLKKEMVANPTTDVAPLIGLLILNDGEVFDRLHPEAYMYETLGGNNSRTALSELCSERVDLAEDQRYTRRMVSIYINLTDEEAQYLAIKHNRQQSFIHQMITQDKVHLCRLKLMNGSERNDSEEMPETTTKWRDECSKTLMTTKVYRKYEEAKKTSTRHAKPDCRGSNFRELRNLEESTVFSMLQRVANDDMMLNELNHECKKVKSMLKLKEAFKNEVGEHTWEEAAQKYPDFATESRLVRFSGKLEGPTLLAFQQYCRSAISSTSSSISERNTSTQILSKEIEGQLFQCHQIKETPESLTYGTVCEALHGISGLSLVICRFTGQPTTEVEQLLRTAHALNRGAGLEGYVVFAQSSPQEIQKHTEALEQHNFSVEILYWKDVDGNNESGGTLFKSIVVPFVVGVMKEDIVKVRVAMGTDRHENIIEGTQRDLYRRLVSTLTLPNDWILDMDPSNGIESTICSVLKEKRNILLVGDSPIILMETEEDERNSQTESDNNVM